MQNIIRIFTYIGLLLVLSSSIILAENNTLSTPPQEFIAFDTPNNCLGDISLRWKAMPMEVELVKKDKALRELQGVIAGMNAKIAKAKAENPNLTEWERNKLTRDAVELEKNAVTLTQEKEKLAREIAELKAQAVLDKYIVCIDKSADGKFEQTVDSFPALRCWAKDRSWPFWVSGKKEGYHYAEINILELYPAKSKEELDKKNEELNVVNEEIDLPDKCRSKIKVLTREIRIIDEKFARANNEDKPALEADRNKLNGEIEEQKTALDQAVKKIPELRAKRRVLLGEIDRLESKVKSENAETLSQDYFFKVTACDAGGAALFTSPILKASGRDNYFNWAVLNNFILMVVFCGIMLWFIRYARKNKNLFLRHINGLDAIEEAVGRATEMGKPIIYQTGASDLTDISTICATVILGKVSEKIAQYDTKLLVPHRDPIVMTVCQETVKEAYLKVGRPDAYKEDSNFYVTGDQFAYTAAVNGMMMREKPAANFFMGVYFAEALLMAECGTSTGAIQIAGTDSTDQLPFFITTCDYTLIGEEYYAASAYLSREPVLVGTLKAQDLVKAFLLLTILVCSVLALFHISEILDLIKDFI